MQTPILPVTQFATVCLFALPVMALTTSFGMALLQLIMLLASVHLMRTGMTGWYCRHFHELRWLIAAFAGYFLLSLLRTLIHHQGLSSLDGPLRMILALSCIGFVAMLRPQIRYFWLGLYLGTIGACLIALVQRFIVGMERADGYTHHPITFGNLSLAMGLLSCCALAGWTREQGKWLPLLALACGLAGTILSGSRGSWLALLLIAPLLFAARARIGRLVLICAAALVLAYQVPATGISHRAQEAVSEVQLYLGKQDATTKVGIRLELWKASWLIFSDHPWLGAGRDQFHPALQQLAAQGRLQQSPALQFSSSHNDALHFLATGGLLDFSFLLLLYGAPLAFFLRILNAGQTDKHAPALAGVVLVLCFIGFGLTDVMFWLMMPKVFYVMMVCVLAGFCLAGSAWDDSDRNEVAHGY